VIVAAELSVTVVVSSEAWRPITDDLGKWIVCRVGVGGGRSTDPSHR
jgi:hypothetical protein